MYRHNVALQTQPETQMHLLLACHSYAIWHRNDMLTASAFPSQVGSYTQSANLHLQGGFNLLGYLLFEYLQRADKRVC
jgi:hypothetical protein